MAYNRNVKHKHRSQEHRSSGGENKRERKRTFRKKLGRHEFYVEGCPTAVKVPNKDPGTLERALKYLKRQMKDADVISNFRERKEFIKPSKKKRIIKDNAVRSLKWETKLEKERWKDHIWTIIRDGKAM